MSEQFSEMQALQDMQDAQIGRSQAIRTKAAMAALNEPFCTEPDHAALTSRLEAAEAERIRAEKWANDANQVTLRWERRARDAEAENAALRAALVAAKRDFLGVQATCAVDYDSVSMLGQDVFNDCFYALKRLDAALTNPTATEGTTGESNG